MNSHTNLGSDAPTHHLILFSATQLRPLELFQNEAMRIILGCPRTAQIKILRAELHLPSTFKIQENTCCTVSRMLCTGSDSLKEITDPPCIMILALLQDLKK
ncbi:hypothetical protein E2C01_050543 [Portunus trituberculatus]|uniref:Uncharacterized protein n=1 Tax=Portunus trituberculatus TaxID=210409 RepID=A0A5B7G8K5_PORTR|nr:hypothetical protein [Portunus trituberculatus]